MQNTIQEIYQQTVLPLSEAERLKLAALIINDLTNKTDLQSALPEKPQYLEYGKYRDYPGEMSTEEDLKIAEWHPTEAELNGD